VTADLLPSPQSFKDGFTDIEIDLLEVPPASSRRPAATPGGRGFVRSPGIVDDLDYEQLIQEALFVALE